MASLQTYLTFQGNCRSAFEFYKTVFKSEYDHIGTFKDMPPDPKFQLTDADMDKIMHVSLPIGKYSTLMGSDSSEAYGQGNILGNNISISITADSEAEAHELFNGLSAGGQATMPLEKTFWGALFGMFTDQFGIQWMVNYNYTT